MYFFLRSTTELSQDDLLHRDFDDGSSAADKSRRIIGLRLSYKKHASCFGVYRFSAEDKCSVWPIFTKSSFYSIQPFMSMFLGSWIPIANVVCNVV